MDNNIIIFEKNSPRSSNHMDAIFLYAVTLWRDDYNYEKKYTYYSRIKYTLFFDPITNLIFIEENKDGKISITHATQRENLSDLITFFRSRSYIPKINASYCSTKSILSKNDFINLTREIKDTLEKEENNIRIILRAAKAKQKEPRQEVAKELEVDVIF